jgi:hypothetical protein
MIPHRLTNVKKQTMPMATASTGRLGKYQCWKAAAERSAVRPSAGRDPAPPVASAGERGEHRIVGTKRLGAGGGDAADPVRPHEDQFGPRRRRGPAEQDADDEQRHRRAPLAQDGALADEQRRDDEDHLIAAAHGEGGRPDPPEHSGVRRGRSNRWGKGSHTARALFSDGMSTSPRALG